MLVSFFTSHFAIDTIILTKFSVYKSTGVQIPPLLSTMIPAEEAKGMHLPNVQYELHDPAEEAELMAHIETHNQSVSNAVDNFNQLMEQWRVEKDAKLKVKVSNG